MLVPNTICHIFVECLSHSTTGREKDTTFFIGRGVHTSRDIQDSSSNVCDDEWWRFLFLSPLMPRTEALRSSFLFLSLSITLGDFISRVQNSRDTNCILPWMRASHPRICKSVCVSQPTPVVLVAKFCQESSSTVLRHLSISLSFHSQKVTPTQRRGNTITTTNTYTSLH